MQASIAALPRPHPGLLVARAQAADLASRLQAHAQVPVTAVLRSWSSTHCALGGTLDALSALMRCRLRGPAAPGT